jgi:NTP pyrophosphatase (non-canonical NTP hydrolase)
MSKIFIEDYQAAASETAIYPDGMKIVYPALGLAGEAGEIANKVKKIYRDAGGEVTEERRNAIGDEIGDVLWYLAALATDLDLDLGDIARKNMSKLKSRQVRGVIGGEGDQR